MDVFAMLSSKVQFQGGSSKWKEEMKLRRNLEKDMLDVDIVDCEHASVKDSRGEGCWRCRGVELRKAGVRYR